MDYESTIELVQGNKVDVTLKYEDGSEYEECFDYDDNLEDDEFDDDDLDDNWLSHGGEESSSGILH